MSKKNIVADSMFYLRFLDGINRSDILEKYIEKYACFYGDKILSEIKKSENFHKIEKILDVEGVYVKNKYDYYELFRPFALKVSDENLSNNGEFEAIIIAHMLLEDNLLCCLVMSDKQARNIVMTHIKELSEKLKWVEEFILESCIIHKSIDDNIVREILTEILECAKNNKCYVPIEVLENYISKLY